MEDIELSRRLKRAGGAPLCLRVARSSRPAAAGSRTGSRRTILAMWRLRFAYWCGADPSRLAARYEASRNVEDRHRPPTLQIFAKAPVPGAVKTRLARTIGDAEAAIVQAQLIERTLATAVAARAAGIVGASSSGARLTPTHPRLRRGASVSASP